MIKGRQDSPVAGKRRRRRPPRLGRGSQCHVRRTPSPSPASAKPDATPAGPAGCPAHRHHPTASPASNLRPDCARSARTARKEEELRTLFASGLPGAIQPKDLCLLFRPFKGYEGSPSSSHRGSLLVLRSLTTGQEQKPPRRH